MRVSFDLDEVLFVSPLTHKTEPQLIFPLNKIYKERLRLGTVALVQELHRQGFEVWIYTSSFRSERYIKGLFFHYGITFDGIVNGQRHEKEVQGKSHQRLPNKLPNKYRISLHIDDEEIIETCGRAYGFNVYRLDAQDDNWCEKIVERIHIIKENNL